MCAPNEVVAGGSSWCYLMSMSDVDVEVVSSASDRSNARVKIGYQSMRASVDLSTS